MDIKNIKYSLSLFAPDTLYKKKKKKSQAPTIPFTVCCICHVCHLTDDFLKYKTSRAKGKQSTEREHGGS